MKTKFIYFITLFFLTVTASAQIDRSVQPKPGPAPKINLGQPQTFELKNGLKVLVVENHKLPRVSARLTIDNGPIFEGEKAGVSALTGSLLGSGTKNISKDDFNEEVDYLGANIYFGSQSAGLNSLSKYFPRVLELMADAAQNPIFSQEEYDKEANILKDGIKSGENSVQNIASRVQNLLAYGKNHPYGEFTSIKTVENVTLADVETFYSTYFKPNNAYLIIVGDVSFKEVQKLVQKHFNKWASGDIPAFNLPAVTNVTKTEIDFVDMPNAVQSDVNVLSTVDFKMTDSDYFAVLLANQIFGGDFNSYLNMNLREAHGYTYGARSGIRPNKYTAAEFSAGAQVRNMVTDSTVMETMKELTKIRTAKVTAEELEIVKATYVGSFVRNIEKPETVARYALNIKTNNLPEDFYETYLDKINSVSIDDIQRVAQKFFSEDNARIVVVGKAVDVIPNLEKLPYTINYFDKEGNKTEKPELTKPIPEGVTKETVLNNYLKAVGGDNIAELKSILLKATASVQGMELTMESKTMAPNKQAVTVSGMGMTLSKNVFNGETGYAEQQGQRKEMTAEEITEKKTETFPFEEIGYLTNNTVELLKIEPIETGEAYVVKIDEKTTAYYNVASGLKIKQITNLDANGQTMTQTMDFGDYKEVGGFKFPHSNKMTSGPQQFEFIVSEIIINKGVSEEDFK